MTKKPKTDGQKLHNLSETLARIESNYEKVQKNNLEAERLGLRYAGVVCCTLIAMTTLIGVFFGKDVLLVLGVGMVMLSIGVISWMVTP